jgi:hypothetical protein
MPDSPTAAEVTELLAATMDEREIEYERLPSGGIVVTLPGEHKQKTLCNLVPGEHALRVEAFVMRHPDENREQLWAYLLQRNARMFGVAFSIDGNGDVYLTGRVSLNAVDPDELDRLLGSVLRYADESFDEMLAIGFRSAIKREWAWRESRGESLANLRAFASWARPSSSSPETQK